MATRKKTAPLSWLQPAVLVGSLVPFAVMAARLALHRFGANPVATLLNQLGLLALVFLLACLACTPAQIAFGVNWPIRLRKTLGLLAFFTALTHFLVYAVVDQGLALSAIFRDVTKRPFILVGFTALVLLVPLALTSTKRALQRMGFTRWKRLHRLVYLVGALGSLHYFMRVKASTREPRLYMAALGLFLGVRVVEAARKARARQARARAAS